MLYGEEAEKMDVQSYFRSRNYYRNLISRLESDIIVAKRNNDNREHLIAQCTIVSELVSDLNDYLGRLKVIQSRAIKENEDFRTRRLDLLSIQISDILEKVFKERAATAKVSCNFNRKNSVRVTLTDSLGYTFNPAMCKGMLAQYLISFSSASCITKTLGINSLFIDEAFGASSMDNLPVVGELVGNMIKDGTFIILVSQNPALYRDLPRREIHLLSDVENNCAKIIKVIDYQRSE